MLVLVLRTVFIYCIIVFSMRLMGKKQLGELQPSELVSTILISNLASICIESPEIPVAGSVVPVLLIVCMEILVSAVCVRSHRLSAFLSGRPKIIIRRGVIDQAMLKQLRFTADDLMEALRSKDVFELSDVELAIVETNGSISVCKRPGADSIKLDDLPLKKPKDRLPKLPVLILGQTDHDVLECLGLTPDFLTEILRKEHCSAQDILILFCDSSGEFHLVKKEQQ